jgi:tRNA(adenine34) deaminase
MFDLAAMRTAIDMARLAKDSDFVPVGAVVVLDGNVIAKAHNNTKSNNCVLPQSISHAEVIALSISCARLKQNRLYGCDLYVTLEPCPLCISACLLMRVKKVVFGAYSFNSCVDCITENYTLNRSIEIIGGVMELDCSKIMSNFFLNKRSG